MSIDLPEKTKLYVFSDIHGDMHSLIVCLRDCARVIRKKGDFDKNILDPDLEIFLRMDLNTNSSYKDDLNYEWCGGDAKVVICGDLIDNYRKSGGSSYRRKINGKRYQEHDYPQIELKIIKFLNCFRVPEEHIYIVLGNHELINMIKPVIELYKNTYITLESYTDNYYKNVHRKDIFLPGNYGFNLFFIKPCYFLLKINNNIFVHGSLDEKPMSYYTDLNDKINSICNISNNQEIDDIMIKFENLKVQWGREFGNTETVTDCNELKRKLAILGCPDCRLIIGHCPQYSPYIDITNIFTTIVKHDDVRTVYGKKIEKTAPIPEYGLVYGMTMDCIKNLFRVDVGVSRAFDDPGKYYRVSTKLDEYQLLLARSPQVLKLKGKKCIRIIRSTIKNTRIHVPRTQYEEVIKHNYELDKDSYQYMYKELVSATDPTLQIHY